MAIGNVLPGPEEYFKKAMREQMMGGAPNLAAAANMGALYPPPPDPACMLHHASVEKAENGFILRVVHKQGEAPKMYIAVDTEDLQRVFIAAIVGERITK